MDRTLPSSGSDTGSIPVGGTKAESAHIQNGADFLLLKRDLFSFQVSQADVFANVAIKPVHGLGP
jgi:hypothetical protein